MRIYICTLLLYIGAIQSFANPWNPKKGAGYAQLSFTSLSYSSGFNIDGDVLALPKEVYDYTFQGYFDYGITDKWGVTAVLPFKMVGTSSTDSDTVGLVSNGNLAGLGNVELYVKRNLWSNNGYVAAAELGTLLPALGADAARQLFTGWDDFGIYPRVSIGKGTDKYYGFISLGYVWFSEFANQTRFSLEVAPKIKVFGMDGYLGLVINGQLTDNSFEDEQPNTPFTYLYSNGAGFVSPGLKMNLQVGKGFEVNLAGMGAFYARFGGGAPTLTVGAAYKW